MDQIIPPSGLTVSTLLRTGHTILAQERFNSGRFEGLELHDIMTQIGGGFLLSLIFSTLASLFPSSRLGILTIDLAAPLRTSGNLLVQFNHVHLHRDALLNHTTLLTNIASVFSLVRYRSVSPYSPLTVQSRIPTPTPNAHISPSPI